MRMDNLDALLRSVRLPAGPKVVPFPGMSEEAEAQAMGATAALVTVPGIIDDVRAGRHRLVSLPDLVRVALNAGARSLRDDGFPPAKVQAWRVGFVRGADMLVKPFLAGLETRIAAAEGGRR